MFFSPFKYTSGFNLKRLFWAFDSTGDGYSFRRNLSNDQNVDPNIIGNTLVSGFPPTAQFPLYSYDEYVVAQVNSNNDFSYWDGNQGGFPITVETGFTSSAYGDHMSCDDSGNVYHASITELYTDTIPTSGGSTHIISSSGGSWRSAKWVPNLNKLILCGGAMSDTVPYSLALSNLTGDIESSIYLDTGTGKSVVIVNEKTGWFIYELGTTNELIIYQFDPTDLTGAGINTGITETYVGRTTDPTGNLYLLTDSNIYKYDTDGAQVADQPINTLTLGATRHLAGDQFGNVYATCRNGIIIFDYDLTVKATLAQSGYEWWGVVADFEPIGYKTNWS